MGEFSLGNGWEASRGVEGCRKELRVLRVRVYEDSFLYRPGPAKILVLKTVLKKL